MYVVDHPESGGGKKALKRSIWVMFFSTVTLVLVPTQKDVLFMAGGVGIIEGTRALSGSSVAKNSLSIVEKWLEAQGGLKGGK